MAWSDADCSNQAHLSICIRYCYTENDVCYVTEDYCDIVELVKMNAETICSICSFSTKSKLDFQFTKNIKFPSSSEVSLFQFPRNAILRLPRVIITSIRDKGLAPFF
jgi:hypothetical protein